MKYPCTVENLPDGRWKVTCSAANIGTLEVIANDLNKALEKLRKEILYIANDLNKALEKLRKEILYRIESSAGAAADKLVRLKIQ